MYFIVGFFLAYERKVKMTQHQSKLSFAGLISITPSAFAAVVRSGLAGAAVALAAVMGFATAALAGPELTGGGKTYSGNCG